MAKENIIKGEGAVVKSVSSAKKIIIITVAAVLAAALIIGTVLGVITYLDTANIDFLNDDLSKYITLAPEDYKGYTVEINVPDVNDMELDTKILTVLASHKNTGKVLNDGYYVRSEPIHAGDKAYIWYRGYTLDENGVATEIDSASNMADADPKELVIGSGSFVPGFEISLVGKVPEDYTRLDSSFRISVGAIHPTDVIYATASYVDEVGSGIYDNASVRIDLKDPQLEAKWGEGALEYFTAMQIGLTDFRDKTFTRDGALGDITYTEVTVNYVTRGEENPLKVTTVFPYKYENDPALSGKTVYFDVYIDKVLQYEYKTLNDEFVTETLGLSAESLAEYEGESVVEKYRSKVRAEMNASRAEDAYYAAEDAMWEYLKKNVKIKKLPEKEVRRIYDNYYYSYQSQYNANYTSVYSSVDAYICKVLGIEETADWRYALTAKVNDEVTEKLIFYTIMRQEGLVPEGEQFEEVYRAELERDFAFYGKTRDDFATDEEYEAALANYEKQVIDYYGAAFYNETVYYNYASRKILDFAVIKNIAKQ